MIKLGVHHPRKCKDGNWTYPLPAVALVFHTNHDVQINKTYHDLVSALKVPQGAAPTEQRQFRDQKADL